MSMHRRWYHSGALALLPLLLAARPLAAQAASGLTLREVYALAAERNPMLRAARAATRAAAAREGSAALPADPVVQLGVMNASLPGLETDMPGAMAPSVQVMQMLPTPGKLALSGRLARQETAIARAAADERAWEVRTRAAMAFYEIWSADRQISVMGETLRLLESFQQVAKSMYAAGNGRQSDVLRASVEVSRMQADLTRMRAMRAASATRLDAVLDRPAGTPVPALSLSPLPAVLPGADTLAAWAEASRPMLEAGRISVERGSTRAALARREIYPDLTVGLQYGQRPDEAGTERMGSVMVGFSVPVFAGKRQLRMRAEAEAMREMAGAELAGSRAEVAARIGELLAELERDRALVELYRGEILPQANATVSSALSAYRVGTVDFMTVMDAQTTVNRYEQELASLLADYGRRVAELEMTVGRELPVTQAAITEDP